MPIIERKGDLLAADMDVLAHGCNCLCTMGAGIARAIATKYPEALAVDLQTIKGDKSKLGSFTKCRTKDSKVIFNLYTQYTYGFGLQLDYVALSMALHNLKNWLDLHDPTTKLKLGMPRIGCGLAGGDWKLVREQIEMIFNNRDVYVYSL